jgi:hypothetical protein
MNVAVVVIVVVVLLLLLLSSWNQGSRLWGRKGGKGGKTQK